MKSSSEKNGADAQLHCVGFGQAAKETALASIPISGLYGLSCVAILRSMLKSRFFLLPLLLLFCSGSLTFASPKPQANAEQNEFFETKIRPLLSSKCFACHGSEIQMAKLNMATAASFFKGG